MNTFLTITLAAAPSTLEIILRFVGCWFLSLVIGFIIFMIQEGDEVQEKQRLQRLKNIKEGRVVTPFNLKRGY